MMKKEQRFKMQYEVNGEVRTCYPRSVERKDHNIARAKELGYRVISCKKLYPFSTEKNQHNFMLVSNICSNRMHDMIVGEVEMDAAEFDRLAELRDKADNLFCLPLPVAWLTWEELSEAKELATTAVIHRQEACVAAGRPDLVTYC